MGPVSSTGRSMMASLNNAVRQGMPVDQAIAYVKSMAKDGVAPLVDLYAMLNQYQRLQQQQMKPPQTPPTIRDNLNMMEAAQQPQMAQGLGGLNAGVMENAQFAGGGIVAFQEGGISVDPLGVIVGESMSGIGRGARAAGSGIASIATSTSASPYGSVLENIPSTASTQLNPRVRSEIEKLRQIIEFKRATGRDFSAEQARLEMLLGDSVSTPSAPSAASPFDYFAPQGASIFDRGPTIQPDEGMRREALAKERDAARAIPDFTAGERAAIQKQIAELKGATPKSRAERYREAGIEDVVPGQIERIRQEMGGLEGEKARDRYLALAEAGFAGAAEAAKPGATFLGSIGVGATAGTRRLGEVNKEYRNLRSNLMGKIDEMERYRQGRLEGQIDRDIEKETKLTEDVNRLQLSLAKLDTEMGKFRETAALTREGREMEQDPIDMLQRQLLVAMESGDEARIKQLSERLAALTELSPSVIVARANERIAASKLAASGPRYGNIGGGFNAAAIEEELARRGG